jgi:cell division protein FtsW (lipid II flippase)
MRNLTHFLLAASLVFTYSSALSQNGLNNLTDNEELIRYIISTIGGIITTVLLAWLRRKFPENFKKKSQITNKYK